MYETRVISERLRELAPDVVKTSAPKAVISAMAKADKATIAHLTALTELDDAKTDLPIQVIMYQQSVEQSVIDDTPTPPTSVRDRAEARVRVAERLARKAADDLHSANTQAGELLADEKIRGEWVATATEKAQAMRKEYVAAVEQIESLTRMYQELVGITYLLNELGQHLSIPFKSVDPCDQLRRITEWEPFAPGRNITR